MCLSCINYSSHFIILSHLIFPSTIRSRHYYYFHFTTEEIGSEGLEGSVGLAAVHSELQRAGIFVNTGSPVSEDAEMHFLCGSIFIGC